MSPDKVRPPEVVGNQGAEEKTPADGPLSDVILASLTNIELACEAFVVLVFTPTGKYVRRVFLSLHHASLAVQRAHAKGQQAWMVLCKLVPVTADPELDSRWSE